MRITHMKIGAYFIISKLITNPVKPTSNIVKHLILSSEGQGTLRDGRGTWGGEMGRGKRRGNEDGELGGDF